MDVFFYGLFMDERLLRERGLNPSNARLARLRGYRLRVARRANLVEDAGATARGVVIDLPPDEVLRLYSHPSVSDYRPVSVCAQLEDDAEQPAICYLLPADRSQQGDDPEYARRLYDLARELGFPEDYLDEVGPAGDPGTRRDEGQAGA